MTPPEPARGPDAAPADGVVVERRDLRRVRSLVTGLLAGVLLLVGLVGVVLAQNQRRCEDGNEFRRQDLPAAFDKFGEFLGQEFHAPPERVAEARDRFAVVMDELFPKRECRFLPKLGG